MIPHDATCRGRSEKKDCEMFKSRCVWESWKSPSCQNRCGGLNHNNVVSSCNLDPQCKWMEKDIRSPNPYCGERKECGQLFEENGRVKIQTTVTCLKQLGFMGWKKKLRTQSCEPELTKDLENPLDRWDDTEKGGKTVVVTLHTGGTVKCEVYTNGEPHFISRCLGNIKIEELDPTKVSDPTAWYFVRLGSDDRKACIGCRRNVNSCRKECLQELGFKAVQGTVFDTKILRSGAQTLDNTEKEISNPAECLGYTGTTVVVRMNLLHSGKNRIKSPTGLLCQLYDTNDIMKNTAWSQRIDPKDKLGTISIVYMREV